MRRIVDINAETLGEFFVGILINNIDWSDAELAPLYNSMVRVSHKISKALPKIVEHGLQHYNPEERYGDSYRRRTYTMFPRMLMHGPDYLTLDGSRLIRRRHAWWFGKVIGTSCSVVLEPCYDEGKIEFISRRGVVIRPISRKEVQDVQPENLLLLR